MNFESIQYFEYSFQRFRRKSAKFRSGRAGQTDTSPGTVSIAFYAGNITNDSFLSWAEIRQFQILLHLTQSLFYANPG